MSKFMIPAGVIGYRGTPEAFRRAQMLLGPLPGGPVLTCPCGRCVEVWLLTYDGPQPLQAPEGIEFLPSFTVIETE